MAEEAAPAPAHPAAKAPVETDWDKIEAARLDEVDDWDDADTGFAAPAPAAPAGLRVTRVKRAALAGSAAAAPLRLGAEEAAAPRGTTVPLREASTLSSEEEDDLARELAELEAEIAAAEAGLDPDEDESPVMTTAQDEDDLDDAEDSDSEEDYWDDEAELDEDDLDEEDEAQDTGDSAWAEDEDEYEDDDLDVAPAAAAPAPVAPRRPAPQPAAVQQDDGDDEDWDEYDEEDAEEDRKWAEAEARIKAEQAAREAEDTAATAEAEARRKQSEMEATIDRLARESVRKTVKMTSPARVLLTEGRVEEHETSVSRLLEQTNSELSEPSGNRRRSAIAHLRAAVAATRADRILGRRRDEDSEKAAYREDLEDVVRPRRPQAGGASGAGARAERPAAPVVRSAPLKLVAEQRVDSEGEAPARSARIAPVRPRRPGSAPAAAPAAAADDADDAGFADYAQSVGAHDLPQLLEAAAAYMSFVEGRDQFSRPQLMSKVREVEARESSREDRLRSFGQLLREGKIQKTRGGRFTASEDIGYRPDRAAG